MYIEPNSIIKIMHNVPLDNTYNHTIIFDSVSAQNSYFSSSVVKYTLSRQSYQRVMKGKMRVQLSAENLYDCNYLSFQNSSFGYKWFYAFITGVEYVNNETSEISFEIDVMQTYLFDTTLLECYVEREHSTSDNAGDNVVDEPINTGDIVCDNIDNTGLFNNYTAVIAHAGFGEERTGGVVSNLFTGVDYDSADISSLEGVENLKTILRNYSIDNRTDSIVSIFMFPSQFYRNTSAVPTTAKSFSKPTSISGYTPRNKKLLTYPYSYLVVDCGNDTGVYRYEWFKSGNVNFNLSGVTTCNPQIACIPMNYNGGRVANYSETLYMNSFPQIAFTIDSYRAYLAQTAIGSIAGGINNAVGESEEKGFFREGINNFASSIIGLMTGEDKNMQGSDYSNFIKRVHTAQHPNLAKGTVAGGADVAIRGKDFYFKHMCLSYNYAQVIDNFFDMFGYATKRVKVPNRTARPHWNYVKTNGCVVKANAPADDVRKICSIYDNGITFWKNPNEVGLYNNLNNSI